MSIFDIFGILIWPQLWYLKYAWSSQLWLKILVPVSQHVSLLRMYFWLLFKSCCIVCLRPWDTLFCSLHFAGGKCLALEDSNAGSIHINCCWGAVGVPQGLEFNSQGDSGNSSVSFHDMEYIDSYRDNTPGTFKVLSALPGSTETLLLTKLTLKDWN